MFQGAVSNFKMLVNIFEKFEILTSVFFFWEIIFKHIYKKKKTCFGWPLSSTCITKYKDIELILPFVNVTESSLPVIHMQIPIFLW